MKSFKKSSSKYPSSRSKRSSQSANPSNFLNDWRDCKDDGAFCGNVILDDIFEITESNHDHSLKDSAYYTIFKIYYKYMIGQIDKQ